VRTLLTAAVIVSLFLASGCVSLLIMAEEKALKDFHRDLEGLSDEQVATAMEMGVYERYTALSPLTALTIDA